MTKHHPAFPMQVAGALKVDDTLGGLGSMMDFRPQPMLLGCFISLLGLVPPGESQMKSKSSTHPGQKGVDVFFWNGFVILSHDKY